MVSPWETDLFRRILLPTTSYEYRRSQEEYHRTFSVILEEKRAYLVKLEAVLEKAQRAKLRSLEQQTQDEKGFLSVVCDSIEKCNVLIAHKKEVIEDIANYELLMNCQTTLDMTGFYNLHDWAKAMSAGYSRLTTSLITLSLAGAGIVYATIFGAVRGNVGLMVFSFSLFSIGFIIPALIQIGLSWAESKHHDHHIPFASQTFWRIAIAVFMALASLAVGSAITMLNITVFELHRNSDALTDNIPRVVPIAVFTLSGLLVLIFLLSMALSVIARGAKTFFLGETYMTRQKKGQQLQKFDHKGMRYESSHHHNEAQEAQLVYSEF